MVKNNANEPGRRPSEDADGNAMGLTEAFHPIASDGFTTVMKPVGETGSVESEEVIEGAEGTFEEVDLGDSEPLDDEGLAAGESFGNEEAFDDFYAGRPAHGRDEDELPAAAPLPTISHAATTKPASKAKGAGPRHGRHAHVATDKQGKPAVPEYMRKSRRMRRILIAVIVILVLLLGALSYFGVQLFKENTPRPCSRSRIPSRSRGPSRATRPTTPPPRPPRPPRCPTWWAFWASRRKRPWTSCSTAPRCPAPAR